MKLGSLFDGSGGFPLAGKLAMPCALYVMQEIMDDEKRNSGGTSTKN